MKHLFQIHPASVGIGMGLVGLVVLLASMAPQQQRVTAEQQRARDAAIPGNRVGGASDVSPSPKAQDIVNVDSAMFADDPGHPDQMKLPNNSSSTIYTVPADRWFVLTHWEAEGAADRVRLVEKMGEVTTVKRGLRVLTVSQWGDRWLGSTSYGDRIGLVFSPGSTVALQTTKMTGKGPAPPPTYFTFHLTGYLADA